MIRGLSSAGLGLPDHEQALRQHEAYADALRRCGVETVILDADENAPDSVFIEDTAVLSEKVAVIARPGAVSRRGEESDVAAVLAGYFPRLEAIAAPGTLDGGDVLRVGDHFFIGISARTNEAGAGQLAAILRQNGYGAEPVPLHHVLHLKTGINSLENGRLLAAGEFVLHPQFRRFQVIPVPDHEAYAANALWINGRVLVAAGFPETRESIENLGIETIAVDVSEFRKLDGGLSCLSLRF
jgi:dimethylargininase